MRYYIIQANHGLVADSQVHCLYALRYLLNGKLEEYTTWIRTKLQQRWYLLREAIIHSSLELLNRQGPTAWVKTKTKDDSQTFLMKKYTIEATYGMEYGVSNEFARINMLAKSNEFDELIWRLWNRQGK